MFKIFILVSFYVAFILSLIVAASSYLVPPYDFDSHSFIIALLFLVLVRMEQNRIDQEVKYK